MIGIPNLDILFVIYSIMFGLLWILIEQAYTFVIGSQNIVSEESKVVGEDEGYSKERKPGCLQEECPLEILLKEKDKSIILLFKASKEVNSWFDPDCKYLSNDRNGMLVRKHRSSVKVKPLLKTAIDCSNVPMSQNASAVLDKSPCIMVMNKRKEVKNNILISVKEITMSIDKQTIENCDKYIESYKSNFKLFEIKGINKSNNAVFQNSTSQTSLFHGNSCTMLVPYKSNICKYYATHQSKLRYYDICKLKYIIQYIITHYRKGCVEEVPSNKKNNTELSKFKDDFEMNSEVIKHTTQRNLFNLKLKKINKLSKVSITELDETEDIPKKKMKIQSVSDELLNKVQNRNKTEQKPKFIRRNKKKNNRKHNMHTLNEETNNTFFSSKQCLSRLACFMTNNQGYNKSKLVMEIEKELEPIKRQINELRDSMAGFSIVNWRYNKKGVKSSTLSVWPLNSTSSYKSKSILTVSSMYSQRLACIKGISNDCTRSCCSNTKTEPKPLSPMAEMYIKLSRH